MTNSGTAPSAHRPALALRGRTPAAAARPEDAGGLGRTAADRAGRLSDRQSGALLLQRRERADDRLHGVQQAGDLGQRLQDLLQGRCHPGTAQEGGEGPTGKDDKYTKFVTQRPAFADDNLWGELVKDEVTVTAEPVVEERSFLANLLISLAPMLLLVLLWVFIARRISRGGMGGGMGGFGRKAPPKPVAAGGGPAHHLRRRGRASTRSKASSPRSWTS